MLNMTIFPHLTQVSLDHLLKSLELLKAILQAKPKKLDRFKSEMMQKAITYIKIFSYLQ